jgi:predicted permease
MMGPILTALDSTAQDVRYGARLLRRSPWFTAVGVLSLAFGLGGGLALFTVTNAVLFRPLQGRLTSDLHAIHTSNRGGGRFGASSLADFRSFSTAVPGLFASTCATTNVRSNLIVGASARSLDGAVVTGGCFAAIDVRPRVGRVLSEADDTPEASPALVISHGLWRRAFNADPALIGREAWLNGVSVVIVGVTETGFAGLSFDGGADFWVTPRLVPAVLPAQTLSSRGDRRFRIFVRPAAGVTTTQAGERLAVVAAQLRTEDPGAWTDARGATRMVTIAPEPAARFAGSPSAAAAIGAGALGAIACLVALASVNLATLTLARGASRTHELSVRLAVGASRIRLLRQLATESLIVSVAALALAAALLAAALRVYDLMRPVELPAINIGFDWRVAGFAILLGLGAPVLYGLVPGAHALRLALAEGLKGRPILVPRGWLRAGPRELLVLVQVGVSFALLVVAALFTRALMDDAASGATPAAASVYVAPVEWSDAARTGSGGELLERLLTAAARLPGVERATAAAMVPMTGSFFGVAARLTPDADEWLSLDANLVAPGYFETIGTPLRAGRTFDDGDRAEAPRVAIVSESLAQRLWQSPVAVGRAILLRDAEVHVVGVVADVPYRSELPDPQPVLYLPLAQTVRGRAVLHVRVSNRGSVAALDRALRAVDPKVLVGPVTSLAGYLDRVRSGGRVARALGAAAGLLQLALALMAVWGLVAYAVERRTTEIAVRRALGATDGRVYRLVLGPFLWLAGAGAALGSAAGLLTAAALHSTFLGLAPLEPALVVPAACLLLPVVAAAVWLPARRALTTEPAAALRQP